MRHMICTARRMWPSRPRLGDRLWPSRPRLGDPSPRGFTLVEMMVAVGILAVLLALMVPLASSLIAQSRARQTLATMSTLEAAIEAFYEDNPFVQNRTVLRTIVIPNPSPPPANYEIHYALGSAARVPLFDRFPPCPTTAFAVSMDPSPAAQKVFTTNGLTTIDGQVLVSPPYPASKEDDADPPAGSPSRAITEAKFRRLINVMNGEVFGTTHLWILQHSAQHPIEYYASIECLVLALSFSPRAAGILEKLPEQVRTNLDEDFAFHDTLPAGGPNGVFDPPNTSGSGGEEHVPLREVVDAWNRPLRYAIREPLRNVNDQTGPPIAPLRYELRSAGEDGVFSPPFTAADRSDDVVLTGP